MITAVQYRLYNDAATSYSLLHAFADAANDTKYNDIGAFQMTYPLVDFVDEDNNTVPGAKTLGLDDGSLVGAVVLYSDGTSQEIERYVIDSTNDELIKDGIRLRQLTGRSTLGVFLEDARVYPSNWPVTTPSGHQFVDATAGTIWRTLIQRAQDRAAATGSTSGIVNIVETGFSGTNASDGAAWALTTGDQNLESGTTYLQVAQDHIAHGFIDIRLDGWNLVIQNGGTFGNHVSIGTVEIRPASNVSEMTKATDSTDSASTILIVGEEGTAVERHSSGAQTIIGRRREGYVSQGGIADSGTLTIIADAELQLVGKINTEETVGIALTALNPWKDFTTSDWVWVRFETDQAPLERRVRQLALSVDENRNITVGMTLNSIIEENDVKLQRKIDGYAGSGGSYGSLPTSPDSSIPNAPTLVSGGVTSSTFVDASGSYVAAVTADWTPPTTNVGGSALTDLDGYELFWRYVGDVNWSPALPATDDVFSWSPVSPGRQIEVKVRSVDNSTNRSGFSSTITHTVAVDTSAPPQPSAPVVSAAYAAVAVKWDGLGTVSGSPVAMPADLDRVEIWQSSSSGFTIGSVGSSLAGTLNKAGTYFVQGAFDVPIYIKMRAVDKAGNLSASSTQGSAAPSRIQTGDVDPDAFGSDGLPPASSPDPVSVSGLGMFYAKWEAITNHDLVYYEVHVSDTLGFTATFGDPTTLVGTTTGTQFAVRRLAGPEPDEGDVDPRTLDYDTTYYIRIIAFDADGAAAQSLQAPAMAFRVSGPDIAVNAVSAENIVAGTITGDLFAATIIMSGTFKTAETGQRVETGIFGIKGYKSDGSVMISIPTTDGEEMILDGEFIARSLTATGGASFQGASELTTDATLTLQSGVVGPSATPALSVTYDTVFLSTSTLSNSQKTGPLGTFDLVPSEVQCIEWKDFSPDYWVVHQVRANGTRAWFFRVDTGAPVAFGSGSKYYTDAQDWAYYSVVQITASTTGSSKNGVYRMARWIPSGAANTYYLHCPQGTSGFNRYSRQNGDTSPALVTEGSDIGILEVLGSGLQMRFFVPTGDGTNLPAPFSSYSSTTGFSTPVSLCTAVYDGAGFGAGTGRYAVAHRGVGFNVQSLTVSSGNLYPGGSGNDWSSVNKSAETWESPTPNRRAIAYDTANSCFWTFGGDGYMYKHSSEQWDPAVTSSTFWGLTTFYDSNATGGTHETKPGSVKSFLSNRRSKTLYVPPSVPTGAGTDAPNTTRLYMARGNTQPANASFHLQYTGVAPTSFSTLNTAAAAPPTVNNFPNATAAMIKSADGNLIISGDNTITRNGNLLSGKPGDIQTFTSNGTWTKPAEAKYVIAECWGAGGAGGPIDGQNAGGFAEGGGGGGGGYSRKLFLASALTATEAVVVGGGGVAGLTSPAPTGGTSSFDSISASGGTGGQIMASSTGSQNGTNGSGGNGSGGDFNAKGGDGGRGRTINGIPCWTNYGGAGAWGGGVRQFIGASQGAGQPGNFPGGGGSGGAGLSADQTGGNGASGYVVVTTYF